MSRLLPTSSEPSVDQNGGEPSVLYVDNEQTRDVISTLSSDTAFGIFQMLNEQPLTPSEVSEELDMSVQNASYHIENLQEANLVEVIDTCYSEKGREMDIYAVTSEPKVLVLGNQNDQAGVQRAFSSLAGALGASAILVAAWQSLSDVAETVLGS
jgi:DNA-binding transcriptional ArsR family regulator